MLSTATQADIAYVVANMRATDKEEIEAVTGMSVEQAVASIDKSPYIAIVVHREKPVAIFGAMLLDGNVASMFRFATDEWPVVVREAIRFGRRWFLAKLWEMDVQRVEAITLDIPEQTAWLKIFGAAEVGRFTRNGRDFVQLAVARPA